MSLAIAYAAGLVTGFLGGAATVLVLAAASARKQVHPTRTPRRATWATHRTPVPHGLLVNSTAYSWPTKES